MTATAAATLMERLVRTLWDFSWIPPDTVVHDRPELLFSSCPRNVPVLNQVVRIDAPADRVPELVEEVVTAHAGRCSLWNVFQHEEPWLAPVLKDHGYVALHCYEGVALPVEEYSGRPCKSVEVRRVEDAKMLNDCYRVGDNVFDWREARSRIEIETDLENCCSPDGRIFRLVAYEGSRPVACGGLTLHPQLGFGFLWGAGTIPPARGRGIYSAVLEARINLARAHGMTHVGLFANLKTSAPIVFRQGFVPLGRMTHWLRPPK